MQSNSQAAAAANNQAKRFSQQDRLSNYSTNINNNYDTTSIASSGGGGGGDCRPSLVLSRPQSRQQIHTNAQMPTSINITAPSPMGSVRDVSRLTGSRGGSPTTAAGIGATTPAKRHSHQDILANLQKQQQQHQMQMQQNALIDKTSQMTLSGGGGGGGGRRSIANCSPTSVQQRAGAARVTGEAQQQQQQQQQQPQQPQQPQHDDKSRSELIDELLKTINDDSFNEFIDFNNKLSAAANNQQTDQTNNSGLAARVGGGVRGSAIELANANRPKSAIGGGGNTETSPQNRRQSSCSPSAAGRATPAPPRSLNLQSSGGGGARASICATSATSNGQQQQQTSTFDNVIRRMSTNFVQNFNKMSTSTLGGSTQQTADPYNNNNNNNQSQQQQQQQYPELNIQQSASANSSTTQLRREKSSTSTYANSLYVDNQVPARRHSDNTINVPRIQVALSSPSHHHSSSSRTNLNQRASVSASKLANKWKLTAKTNQREASDKLSPNLSGALGYIRRHSSGNAQGGASSGNAQEGTNNHNNSHHQNHRDQNQSNGGLGAHLLNASPFKTKSSSNLGIDFLMSNRSMKRRYSAASMLGHQTQRKAEDLIDAGMKSVQNMFS